MKLVPEVRADSRYEFAAACAKELRGALPSKVVFDIGAGLATMRSPMQAAGLEWRGFDLLPSGPEVVRWDLEKPCPAEVPQAGLALLLDVLEHLKNPGLALRHVAATLLPGGRLVLTTPNPRWSRSRVDALLTGFPTCFKQSDLDGNGHVFPVWPHILERYLGDCGLTVERYCTLDGRTRWPAGPPTARFPLRFAGAALHKWLERRDASACGMSFGVVACKT